MKYVLIGKIANTHGLRGEIKIISDFIYKDRYLRPGVTLYIGKDKISKEIISYRPHKMFDMVFLEGIKHIDEATKYKGLCIFGNKEDLELSKREHLDEDLIGLEVICDNITVGKVKKVIRYSKNNLLLITNEKKDFYIPYNFDIIKKIDLTKKNIIICNIKGMIE